MAGPATYVIYVVAAAITLGMQFGFFLIAWCLQTDKVTDMAYSLNFMTIAVTTLLLSGEYHTRKIVVTCLVCLWGLRLMSYLVMRVHHMKRDKRFDSMRKRFWGFLGFWTIQALTVYLVAISLLILNATNNKDPAWQWSDYLGWIFFGIGWPAEAIADQQKFNFKKKNPDAFMRSGLWSWSRHPNYFGEMMMWIGVFFASLAVYSDAQWVAVLSPVFITLMLLFVSGIPLLEKKADKVYGSDPAYQEYKARTSILIPFPPSWCCCASPANLATSKQATSEQSGLSRSNESQEV